MVLPGKEKGIIIRGIRARREERVSQLEACPARKLEGRAFISRSYFKLQITSMASEGEKEK